MGLSGRRMDGLTAEFQGSYNQIGDSMRRRNNMGTAVGTVVVLFLALSQPGVAEEAPARSGQEPNPVYKGLFQLDIAAAGVSRDILQDTGGGFKDRFTVDSTRLFAKLSIKPLSFLEIYGLGGGADLSITNVANNPFYGRIGPMFGGGLRFTLYETPAQRNISVYLDANYLQITSTEGAANKTFLNSSFQPITYRVSEKMLWREFGADLGVKGRFAFAGSPEGYAALRMSWLQGTTTFSGDINQSYDFTESGVLAFILGGNVYFDPAENVAFNVEIGIGEPSYLTGGFKFWF